MKKLLILLLFIILSISLFSCNPDIDLDAGNKDGSVTYYGVGTRIHELDNTCVYIPDIGDISIPELKSGDAPVLREGDLVRIYFEDGKYLQMLMCYPGRFAQSADEIEVKRAEVGFRYIDDAFYYTDNVKSGEAYEIGDEVSFVKMLDNSLFLYCSGTVTEVSAGRVTVRLSIESGAQDFLCELMADGIEMRKTEKEKG